MLNEFRTLVHQIACAILCASKDTPAVYCFALQKQVRLRICFFKARTLPLFSSSQLYSSFSTSTINPCFTPHIMISKCSFFLNLVLTLLPKSLFVLAFQLSKHQRV